MYLAVAESEFFDIRLFAYMSCAHAVVNVHVCDYLCAHDYLCVRACMMLS